MAFRLRREESTVNVNARFAKLSSDDLETVAEASLMNAGAAMDRWRRSGAAIDLDEAVTQSDQAHQALVTIHHRLFV